jgi:uncharacterized protein
MSLIERIATELRVKPEQVNAAVTLLDAGDTVPFISRYRKEVTGGLTDTDLRTLEERLHYLRELEARRTTILESIQEQGKLTPELKKAVLEADNKASLEDIYLPYKPKRRTKAQIAREAGLEPLALQLWQDPNNDPATLAPTFLNKEHNINTVKEALDGARDILMEQFSENAALVGECRENLWQEGVITTEVIKGKEVEGNKFSDYFEYREKISTIPSHRALAILRGQREGFLKVSLTLTEDQEAHYQQRIQNTFNLQALGRPADAWLQEVVRFTWKIKLFLKLDVELMLRLREAAEEAAITVFANNLKNLLMTSPAGARTTLGLDPGLRTGVKAVVIDKTGKLLENTTIFPHAPRNDWDDSLNVLAKLCKKHNVELVSIGNGTASRETDKLVADLKKRYPDLNLTSIVISEAGASVYSASPLAAQEFPNLDVTYRGAVSIARRLQDPLAELVKIEPKAIGVGQYQHDVNQLKLSRTLRAVMEDCVNAVGVEINTASAPLLSCVAGLSDSLAQNIITYRETHGAFQTRQDLKKVPRLGDKSFEQCAGFLRITQGQEPLDASAVHPEAYPIVQQILNDTGKTLAEMMGNTQLIAKVPAKKFVSDQFGLPTITDILRELEKPGRDPRPEFKAAQFDEAITELSDLKPGMILEGAITNVANFGAFVDIGVHQDGLVHISLLSDRFVKDPNEVVKVGDIVKVKVMEVDLTRRRIQLSMRLTEKAAAPKAPAPAPIKAKTPAPAFNNTLGSALLSAMKGRGS